MFRLLPFLFLIPFSLKKNEAFNNHLEKGHLCLILMGAELKAPPHCADTTLWCSLRSDWVQGFQPAFKGSYSHKVLLKGLRISTKSRQHGTALQPWRLKGEKSILNFLPCPANLNKHQKSSCWDWATSRHRSLMIVVEASYPNSGRFGDSGLEVKQTQEIIHTRLER